ncbi:MAG: type II secretion system F family protein [Candidatus Aenigmarchaeota archaeon]|nr:type II secretion system F family protein [Candidatus Aenigmarchaeota archaeon]
MTAIHFLLLGFIIILLLSLYGHRQQKKRDLIENFPRFFQEVYNNCASGMTLVKAVKHSKYANYGSLTPEIRNLCLQIEWGIPFPVALKKLSKKINDPFISRMINLVDKASEFSPNIGKSMNEIYSHIALTREIERERSAALFPQLISFYLIFFVMLATILLLFRSFIPSFGEFNLEFYRTLFTHLIIIEAVISGLAIGRIVEDSFKAGIKHVLILLFVGIFFIYFYSI